MKKNKQTLKAAKPTKREIKCYVDSETYKKFKKKTGEQGMHLSQWIRHQITKWVK